MLLTTEQKAGLIVISFVVCVIAGLLIIYLENQIWIIFCIINIITWGLFGLFLFITFLVKYVEYKAEPELSKDKIQLQEQIIILEAEKRQLEREAKRIEQESLTSIK